jgi:hypothetical protein
VAEARFRTSRSGAVVIAPNLPPLRQESFLTCEMRHRAGCTKPGSYSCAGTQCSGPMDEGESSAGRRDMPTVKHLVGIAIAIAMPIVGASAFGIGAVEHSATQAPANRFTPSKADFRLDDHQRLRKMLLGREGVELALR